MGKISKLMKLLSASAVVAGANSVALADCGLCGEREHHYGNCPHFDYEKYSRIIGFHRKSLKDGDKVFLGRLAVGETDKERVAKCLNISSSIVSSATPSSGVASSANSWSNTETTTQSSNEKPGDSDKINTLKLVEREQNLEDRDTTISESDAEEMRRQEEAIKRQAAIKIQRARRAQLADREETERAEAVQHLFGEDNMKALARERDTKELKNMLNERRETARNLNGLGKTLDEKKKESIDLFGARGLEYDAQRRGAEEARSVAEENREKINISEDDKTHIKVRNILDRDQKKEERAARRRDREELQSMMAGYRDRDRLANESEAADLRLKRRNIESERALRKERDQQQETQQSDSASESRNIEKLQARVRGMQARKKAAELKAEAERQGKIQEHRENAAARKITEALRANKEAQRQAQIAGDYELAKKLQAEYDAEDRQIREDRKYARKLQKKLDKKAVKEQIKADRKLARQLQAEEIAAQIESDRQLAERLQAEYDAEDAQIRAERRQAQIESDRQLAEQLHAEEVAAQIAADHQLAKETQEKFDEERRVAAMPRQQEEFRQRAVGDSEAVETDRWSLPEATKSQFKGFNFNSRAYQMQGKVWARQLKDLSIRKVECILWLVGLSYWDLLQDGGETGSAEIYEAVYNVKDIFPKTGPEVKVSPAIMNVYNAFENTSPADFEKELAALGSRELNGVLYFVAQQYAQLLKNGKKAADKKLIELAKAAVEHFDRAWEAEDAEVFEESEAREADNTESAVVNENRQEPAVSATAGVQGIVETERAEDTEWDIPYVLHEVLRWPLGSYRGGDNRRVYLGKFNEALQDLGIRRLEVVMYLAASSYQFNKVPGQGALGEQSLKLAEDIHNNVFPDPGIKRNARLENCYRALENKHDKRLYFGKLDHYGRYSFENNDPDTYEASFQGAFRRITAGEQEVVLGKIATLYREKLREGKRPSSMLFVDFADEICKELNLDGFFGGEDTEEDHPAWDKVNKRPMWEFRKEFESDAQPAVVNPQNADQNTVIAEDPETNPWQMPERVNRALMYDPNFDGTEVLNEGKGLDVQEALQRLTVRQLEAVIGLSVHTYKLRSGAENMYGKFETAISNEMLEKAGELWSLILSAPKDNERLLHVHNALRSASNAKSLTEDLNALPLRKVESFLGMVFRVYKDKLRHGVVPADEAFVTMTDKVLELLGLNYDEEETPAGDNIRRGALDGDNRALVEPIGA